MKCVRTPDVLESEQSNDQTLAAGAAEDDLTLSTESARAIEQLTQWQAAGYNHVTIRFPDRDPGKFADSLRRFHDTVMKPLGAVQA